MKIQKSHLGCISASNLDDLLNEVFKELLSRPFNVEATRGVTSELLSINLHLENPRARLSRTETKGTPFSALGELIWYLSGTDRLDFIQYYIYGYTQDSEDGKTIYGAYGPRLFNNHGEHNQILEIIKLLKEKPSTRRAIIQIFDSIDLSLPRREIPCTCTLQFIIREEKLHMFTNMRSNDAFLGLSHDIFTFTMLQEIIARTLSIEIGSYSHAVGSLHLYERHKKKAEQFLNEGYQATTSIMPSMPNEDPWPAIELLKKLEIEIRLNDDWQISDINLKPYWIDWIRLLWIYSLFKRHKYDKIREVQKQMNNTVYNTYIDRKIKQREKK